MTPTDEQVARALTDALDNYERLINACGIGDENPHAISLVKARATIAAMPPQGDGLAELRALLDEHDKACGPTIYTPSSHPPARMHMYELQRQTFAAMYAHVRRALAGDAG